jgi:two-component system NtrC family sensor kinase
MLRPMVERPLPRVLIVDDQPGVAHTLSRLLAAEANVVIATSGFEALERIERGECFDLVLCDIMMPLMTGLQLFDRVRAVAPQVASAFVFITGGLPPELEKDLRATGKRCLEKPVKLVELTKLLTLR